MSAAKSGIVKINNALLELPYREENLNALYHGIYFFTGSVPTKEEFDEYYKVAMTTTYAGLKGALLDGDTNTDRVFLAELRTERAYNTLLTTQEQCIVRLASDPQELVITKEGTPTWALIVTDQAACEPFSDFTDTGEVEHVFVATVGNVGSGEDIEVKDGVIALDVTYKLNSLRIRLEEI